MKWMSLLTSASIILLLFTSLCLANQSNTQSWAEEPWDEIGSEPNGAPVDVLVWKRSASTHSQPVNFRNDATITTCQGRALKQIQDVVRQFGYEPFKQIPVAISINISDQRSPISTISSTSGLGPNEEKFETEVRQPTTKGPSTLVLRSTARIIPYGGCQLPKGENVKKELERYYSKQSKRVYPSSRTSGGAP